MDKSKLEMKDTAFKFAKKYEAECGDCAQGVVAGVFEALGISNDDVFRAATGFADGIGLTGDGHCGARHEDVTARSHESRLAARRSDGSGDAVDRTPGAGGDLANPLITSAAFSFSRARLASLPALAAIRS